MRSVDRPVGIFDSGVGGLSILREVHEQLPGEDVIYLADQAWAPYGSRKLEDVRGRAVAIAAALLDQGAKAVVVACNSASAAALYHLREAFPETPFVGMEPALKPAAADTNRGIVGVLATAATFQGELYASVLDTHAIDVAVHEVAGERLTILIEDGRSAEVTSELERLLAPLLDAGIDTLVLGCTHYAFITAEIRNVVGPGVVLVDPSPAVARQLGRVLDERQWRNDRRSGGETRYLTSGDPDHFVNQLKRILDVDASAEAAGSIG